MRRIPVDPFSTSRPTSVHIHVPKKAASVLSTARLWVLRRRVRVGVVYLCRNLKSSAWIAEVQHRDFSVAYLRYRSLRQYRRRPEKSCIADIFRRLHEGSMSLDEATATPMPLHLGLDLEDRCPFQELHYKILDDHWRQETLFVQDILTKPRA